MLYFNLHDFDVIFILIIGLNMLCIVYYLRKLLVRLIIFNVLVGLIIYVMVAHFRGPLKGSISLNIFDSIPLIVELIGVVTKNAIGND